MNAECFNDLSIKEHLTCTIDSIYVTGFDKSRLPHTQWQDWLFTTTWFLHQWTNNSCVYHCQCVPGLLFLGLVSWTCLMCLNAWVVKTWPSNWLLFVISIAQIGLRLDHLEVFNSVLCRVCKLKDIV